MNGPAPGSGVSKRRRLFRRLFLWPSPRAMLPMRRIISTVIAEMARVWPVAMEFISSQMERWNSIGNPVGVTWASP